MPSRSPPGLGLTAPPDGDVIDHLVHRLRHKRLLLVVDNCEHVLAAAADAVERIVGGCPTVTVLATSREPLMVRGERLVPVPSLPPDDAERLFLDRARGEAPDLVIDDDQRRAVTELCRRLDGLPLALELAASRVRALTPGRARHPPRRTLPAAGRRSTVTDGTASDDARHARLVLRPVHRRSSGHVFDRLSVFPAGFDLAAARGGRRR